MTVSNVTDINKNKTQTMIINTKECQLDTKMTVLDSTGKGMIVGERYEMYAPAAKNARDGGLGLVWADNDGFSFIYEGVLDLNGQLYLGSNDVSFDPALVPHKVYTSMLTITKLFGACMICPTHIAANVIRPVTIQ